MSLLRQECRPSMHIPSYAPMLSCYLLDDLMLYSSGLCLTRLFLVELIDPLGDEVDFEGVDISDPFGLFRVLSQAILIVMMNTVYLVSSAYDELTQLLTKYQVHWLVYSRLPSRSNVTLRGLPCQASLAQSCVGQDSRSIAMDHDLHRYKPIGCTRSKSHLCD